MTADLPVTDVVLQFTLVITMALVVQFTLERSRIPGIVGLLLVGMIVGPGGLAVLPEEPVVELLGMRIELEAFGRIGTWGLAGALLAVVIFGKSSAAWITGRLYGYGRMDRLAMIGMTLPQAAATLAVTVIGRQMELIGDEVEDAVIIVIFLTCLIGPIVTSFRRTQTLRWGRPEVTDSAFGRM